MNKEAKILIGITIATILALVGGSFFFSKKDSTPVASTTDNKVYDQSLIFDSTTPHVKGPENAPVTIVEFGDFECPACGVSYPITKELEKTYGNKIKFVFRQFPLEIHSHAYDAARAAEAASAQGKFWEMHDKLYERQSEWEGNNGAHPDYLKIFEGYAKEIGLDMAKYTSDMNSKAHDSVIQKGLTDGTALGVPGTPAFFVNGKMIFRVMTLEEWKNLLGDSIK